MSPEGELVQHDAVESMMDFDFADEDQIIAEMSGRVSDKYVYTFKQGGQDVTGLSFAGTNWAVREYAKQGEVIRIVGKPEIMIDPTDPDYIVVSVSAQRFAVSKETGKEVALDSTIGIKRQCKFMEKKKYDEGGKVIGKESIVDPFFFEKCFSKAIRNAKQALIPTDIIKRLISMAIDSKNTKVMPKKEQGQQHKPQQNTTPQGQQAKPVTAPTVATTTAQQTKPVTVNAAPQNAPTTTVNAPQAQAAPTPTPAPVTQPAAQATVTPPPVVQPQAAAPAPAPQAQPAPQMQEIPKDVLVQKLDAALKAVFKTQDAAVARQGLQALTGVANPSDMTADKIKQLGNTLNAVLRGQARVEGNKVIRIQDGVALLTGPEVAIDPAAAAAMF